MTFKTRKRTLADKINSLLTTTPGVFHSDDELDDTKAKLVDHFDESDNSEDDFQASDIRKRNIDLLDQVDRRYKGKKVSRKDVYNDTDDNDDDDGDEENNDGSDKDNDEDDDNFNSRNKSKSKDIQIGSNDESSIEDDTRNTEDDNVSDDDSDENDSSNESQSSDDSKVSLEQFSKDDADTSSRKEEEGIQTMSRTNLRADIEKGNCVKSQLKLWENLLEMRIKLQKCLTTSNQMPQHDVYKDLKTETDYAKTVEKTKGTFNTLLNNMIQLQSLLLKQYPETRNLSARGKKRKAEESIDASTANTSDPMDEEIPSDTEDENNDKDSISDADEEESNENENENVLKKKMKLDDYEKILNDNHKSYVEYRNSVIEKWDEKTRVATGKWNKGISETTMKQIQFALSDKEKLRKRSRLKRSEYKIVGKAETTEDNDGRRVQEYDSEIYDDDDFYHQLLRDLIEYKSSDITDPIQLSKQWIQLQNMRRKMKRKIDTRATKGRRIRYNVHNKLVNFMAPITVNDTWTDLAKDELYNSLFGKIKPINREVNR